MASNIFNSIRKSYTVHVLLTSVMTNLLVLGEPAMAMMTDYYNYKEVKRHASQHHLPQFFTPDILDNASENVLEENQEVPVLEDALKHRLERSSFMEASVFYAPEKLGVIGKRSIYEGENPQDNFFTIVLPDVDFSDYEGILQYELYGVSGASQTTKSINNFSAYGGEIITINDEWIQIEEVVSSTQLKKGVNEIFFNRRSNENYLYKIKNLGIKLTQKNHNEFDLPKDKLIVYNGDLYFSGIVNDEKVEKLSILNQDVYVSNGVYEAVITNIPESLNEVEIRLQYSDNRQEVVYKQLINYNINKADFSFSSILSTKSIENYTQETLVQGCVSHNALSVTIDDVKQLTKEHTLVTEGLHFKDTRILNEDLENVTAGDYFGYRINKMPIVEDALVELRLKYDSDKIPAGYTPKDVKIFSYDKLHKSWKALAVDAIDYDNEEIVSTISAVSANETDFINGVIKVPESPETASFAPTTITDMKYADPSAGVVSIAPPSPNSTGAAATSFPLKLPQGRNGMQPNLEVTYNSEAGNGWMGIGWNLSTPAISINTKWGVPLFTTSHETEIYSLNGADLVLKLNNNQYSNPHRTNLIPRASEREFYLRKEGSYQIIIRHGSNPQNYYWEVIDKQGNQTFYGGLPGVGVDNNSVIKTSEGHIAHWGIKRTIDTYGNYIEYSYDNSSPTTIGGSPANEFYVSSIKYTLKSGVNSYYKVDFIKNNYSVGIPTTFTQRTDVTINARNGYLQLINKLLTEVKVSFYDHSQEKLIRTYRFDYNKMIFNKQQLTKISEFDSNNNLFYNNVLEYYNETNENNIISSLPQDWAASGNDIIHSPLHSLMGVSQNNVPKGSLLGSSVSEGFSFGLRAGVGLGIDWRNVSLTVGGSVNYSSSSQDTRVVFMDINGDGLPDKVYKGNNQILYRANTGTGFSHLTSMQGINSLSTTKSKTFGYGFDVTAWQLGVGKSWSKTTSETDNYFTDFNGDGLPDLVTGNRVKFNKSNNGVASSRKFELGSGLTENQIISGGIDPGIIPDLNFPGKDEVREQHSQYDHIKVWEAPYTGTVQISAPTVVLTNICTGCSSNKFRLRIEKANSSLDNPTIIVDSRAITTTTSYNLNNIAVSKGDVLFFRIHNEQYGWGGEIEWNPKISYTAITSQSLNQVSLNKKDENKKDMFIFDSKEDYLMNNGGGADVINVFESPILLVTPDFNFSSTSNVFNPPLSDDVRFVIKKTRKNSNGTFHSEELKTATYNKLNNNITNIQNSPFIPPGPGFTDEFYAYIESDSNVNWNQIDWQPKLTKSNTITYPGVTRYIYDDNINQSKYWIEGSSIIPPVIAGDATANYATIRHTMFDPESVSHTLLSNIKAEAFPIAVNWVIKTEINGVIQDVKKRTFYVHRSVVANPYYPFSGPEFLYQPRFTESRLSNSPLVNNNSFYFNINYTKQQIKEITDADGKIYAAFYISNKTFGLGANNLNSSSVIIEPFENEDSNNIFTEIKWPFMAISPKFYGVSYRGWGQFLYNGGVEFPRNSEGEVTGNFIDFGADNNNILNSHGNNSRIDLDALPINMQQSDFDEDVFENTDPDEVQGEPKAIRYVLYKQGNLSNEYSNRSIINSRYGFNNDNKLTVVLGRFGESNIYDVWVDPNTIISGGSDQFVAVKQYSESHGSAKTGDLDLIAGSLSGTHSEASSRSLNQYIDLNGDRYPDIVTKSKIQYTNMLGGLSQAVNNDNFTSGDHSEDRTQGITLAPMKPNSTELEKAGLNKTITNINSGINNSNGESFDPNQWIDMNGDGLPDKVWTRDGSVTVSLNLGYDFSNNIEWGNGYGELLSSQRSNSSFSLGTGAGINPNASYAVGLGGAKSTANIVTTFADVNGDGLPDLIIKNHTNGQYKYHLNTGSGFMPNSIFMYTGSIERDVSVSGNIFGSVTVGFSFPILWVIWLKVVASPSASINASFNEKTITFQDINGDGLPDILSANAQNNNTVTAYLNKIGKTHLLKKVTTPLSGSWTIDYERNGNTYDLPQSKWVLSSIKTFDNFTADNAYRPDTTQKTVAYENPKYDRRERDFLGYGKVKISDINNNSIYRTLETTYHNENYYLSGAEKSTALYAGTNDQLLSEQETFYNILNPENPQVAFFPNMGAFYMQGNNTLLDQSRLLVVPVKVETTSYEGSQSLVSEKRFLEYDTFGNLTTYLDKGEGGNDAFVTRIAYYTQGEVGVANGTGFPSDIRVYKENDQSNFFRNRKAEYNNFGKLRRVITVLNSNEDNMVDFEYDNYGNLNRIDYLNNLNASETEHYTLSINYDNTLHTYPVETTNSFGETSYAEYDYWFGIPVLTTDKNAEKMRTRIDNRGRIVEVTGPNEYAQETGANKKWTIRMEYKGETVIPQNHSLYPEEYVFQAQGSFAAGTASNNNAQHYAVTRHFDPEISGNQLLTISIVDGFGQAVQLKKTHYAYNESSLQNVLGWLTNSFDKTDALGRSTGTYLPSFLSSYPSNINALGTHRNYTNIPLTTAFTETTYDHRDRPLTVQQIGENDQAVMTYGIESGMFMQQVVNEKGQTYTSYTDKRGRNRKTVQEDINTYFAYNAINELVSVTNQNGFVTNYKYDLAGRKTEVQHPDRGVTRFVYDRAGNITEQTNSNLLLTGNGQQTIKYKYDFGRLIAVTYPQTPENNVNYTYGDPSDIFAKDERAIGRLLYQEDASGVQVFGYGRMGELTKNLRSVAVAGYQSYWFLTQWEYDSWNRVQKIIYPDKEVVDYEYNKAGMLYSISGQLPSHSPTSIVERIDYNAYGERRSIKYGNGTYTTYNYDNRRRMDALKHSFNSGSQWYDLEKKYDYDPLSNIRQITTLEPETVLNNTAEQGELGGAVYHKYKYDAYNRLTYADGHYVGTNDLPGIPYLKQDYVLNMEYNNDHTIKSKTQFHQQSTVEAYGAPIVNSIPMAKTSYRLDYSAYNTGAYVIGNDDFGYSQPHAPRQIVEYPFDGAELEDPRTRVKNIKYDANGNQTEITETLGEVTTSLRKNLWDEENRLRAVDLKPSETNKPIAIYTYDAGGERIVRYNYDKMDAHSNALFLNKSSRDNVMLYPNGLLMAKALKVDPEGDIKLAQPLSYTKHYYIGSERVSAKTGTMDKLGYYPLHWVTSEMPFLNIAVQDSSANRFTKATEIVMTTHGLLNAFQPTLSYEDNYIDLYDATHDPKKMDIYYFHPDHLGSSSYITNMAGMVSQHMEYLPFGELLVDEHKNSYNSPFKYNGKEFDEETGNYFYGARYYDPKWSIFISVDPLAEKFPAYSSYNYALNNPIRYIDPDGRAPQDHIFYFRNGKFEKMVDTGVGNKLYFNIDGKNVSLSPFASGNQSYFKKVSEYYAREIGFSGIVNHKLSYDGDTHAGGYYDPIDKSVNTVPNTYNRDNLYDIKSIITHEYHHSTQGKNISFIEHAETYMFEAQQSDFGKTSDDYKANNAYQFANRLINALYMGEFDSSEKSISSYINDYNKRPNTLKIKVKTQFWSSGELDGSIYIQGRKPQSYEKLEKPEH